MTYPKGALKAGNGRMEPVLQRTYQQARVGYPRSPELYWRPLSERARTKSAGGSAEKSSG